MGCDRLLYLDFISDPETIAFLQLGKEGECYNAVEGGYEKLATTGDWLQNSLNNIDYTITVNGLYLGDATTVTTALGYEKVDSDHRMDLFDAGIIACKEYIIQQDRQTKIDNWF